MNRQQNLCVIGAVAVSLAAGGCQPATPHIADFMIGCWVDRESPTALVFDRASPDGRMEKTDGRRLGEVRLQVSAADSAIIEGVSHTYPDAPG
ncbi:MAG TPA: hypothetical protein VG942_19475, partial [Hyphomonadaceae bacterium]|nr:hypothetical protein [Hyphomonadaceae bacterium]